ncbi:MAG: SynChlorMet cassette protein ScmC [Desulfomonile tiedjei]|uniref:SynChlorMet cassette protein ScmC n=1 Tax=Desulfomonile tiedjei TaxID=2358 RepID=A0A9D6V0Q9_9BACT|nr:SynChlorMet cassette protein ScmC [Desulfomonile tiedjei]
MSRVNSNAPSPLTESPATDTLLRGDPEYSYRLDLGAGLSWCISGTGEAQPLLERLASVLGMQPGTNDAKPRLVLGFNPTSFKERHLSERIPSEGWMVTDFMDSRIWSHSTVEHLFCEIEWHGNPNSLFRVWSLIIHSIYSRAIEVGGLPIHAALIEREGIGVALVGASGRGKSTCCRRVPTPWQALSDDHTLVLASAREGFGARPFPTWGDLLLEDQVKLPSVQNRVALSAVFFLEQAQSDEVKSIGQGVAALRINQSASQIFGRNVEISGRPQAKLTRTRLFENACNISKAVKTYTLRVSLKGRFWEKINEVLS